MVNTNTNLMEQLLSNLKIDIESAELSKTGPGWHWMNRRPPCNRLFYILDGEGCVEIRGTKYYPKKGQMVIVPANTPHSLYNISQRYFYKYWCRFYAISGEHPLFDLISTPYIVEAEIDNDIICQQFNELTSNYIASGLAPKLKAKANLLNLLSIFLQNINEEEIQLSEENFPLEIQNVLRYIDEHLSEPITIETLARVANFHPNYFIRQFKHYVGNSPMEYVTRLRINKAKLLLRNSNQSISLIAALTGFDNPSYFSKVFKGVVGISPQHYRKYS